MKYYMLCEGPSNRTGKSTVKLLNRRSYIFVLNPAVMLIGTSVSQVGWDCFKDNLLY